MPSRFENLEIWQTAHREVVDKTNQTIAYSAWPVFVVSQLNGFADLFTEELMRLILHLGVELTVKIEAIIEIIVVVVVVYHFFLESLVARD